MTLSSEENQMRGSVVRQDGVRWKMFSSDFVKRIFVSMATWMSEGGNEQQTGCERLWERRRTHSGVGLPVALQVRTTSSRENAVTDLGTTVSLGGVCTENTRKAQITEEYPKTRANINAAGSQHPTQLVLKSLNGSNLFKYLQRDQIIKSH